MDAKQTSLKMLIVDDENGISESLKDYFELEDFHVETASSGNKALEILKTQKFDVVVSDVRMPDGDGRHLLKSIRKIHPTYPTVIMMSGFSDLSIEEALNEGGLAILTKPFHPNELMKIINQKVLNPITNWKKNWDSTNLIQIKVEAKNISNAQELNLMNVGKIGFFLKKDPSGLRVGDNVEINLTLSNQKILGCVRWVRNKTQANQHEGMGIEIIGSDEALQKEFIDINKNKTPVASIPLS